MGSSNSSHSNPRDFTHERLETHLEAEQSENENEDFYEGNIKGKINAIVTLAAHCFARGLSKGYLDT